MRPHPNEKELRKLYSSGKKLTFTLYAVKVVLTCPDVVLLPAVGRVSR